jgi:hypothetical protein
MIGLQHAPYRPPDDLLDAAALAVPAVFLAKRYSISLKDTPDTPSGLNVWDIVSALEERGHPEGAGFWAIDQLLNRGFLTYQRFPNATSFSWEGVPPEELRPLFETTTLVINGQPVPNPLAGADPPEAAPKDEGSCITCEVHDGYDRVVRRKDTTEIHFTIPPYTVEVSPTPQLWHWWQHSSPTVPSLSSGAGNGSVAVLLDETRCSALVRGVSVELTRAQFDVIKAVLDAWPKGLKKGLLIRKSGHTDAVGILTRLAKKPHWKDVIQLPGRAGKGYRIA